MLTRIHCICAQHTRCQVPTLGSPNLLKATYTLLHLFLVALLAAIPSLILNAPVGLVARVMAETERKRALAGSVVKITARDVMMSKKIIISIVMVPTLWLAYAALLFFLSDWQTSTKVLAVLAMPAFSYAGVMATEAGMVDAKDLKPVLMRLLPEVRREMLALPAMRARLQQELREFVTRVGPSL
jgi:glycerol-3-phosphate O-acyltransferase / dihydroxyacetone phosphate acyltransferase